MKTLFIKIIFLLFFIFTSFFVFTQNDTVSNFNIFRHSVSLQLNYVYDGIDGVIWHDFSNVKKRFAALRYGYIYNNNISFGAEISRAEYLSLMSDTTMRGYAANVNIGGFSRFSLNKTQKF